MPKLMTDGARKTILRSMAALVAGLALASAAAAAIAPDRAPQGRPSAEPAIEDLRALRQFARCIVVNEPGRVRALLGGDYTSDAYRVEIRRLATTNNGCLPPESRLASAGVLLAGNLAEALLRGTAPRGTLAQRVAFNPAAAPFRAHDEGEVMSICVVRAAPAETEAVLATAPGSPEEAATLRAITPHVGPCLASGAAMRFNRHGLRALLALAAYRLVRHNQAAATAVASGN